MMAPNTASPVDEHARRTLWAYRLYADRAIASWERAKPSAWLRRFAKRVRSGGRVLDYGCGIGTDLAWLANCGLSVEGVDGSPDFVAAARRHCPSAEIRVAQFERFELAPARYDGIWSNASLIHVPRPVLEKQLDRLAEALLPGGVLGLTLAWGRSAGYTDDWIPGRFIASYSLSEAAAMFRRWQIDAVRVANHDGRRGRWIQLFATPNKPRRPARRRGRRIADAAG